MIEIPVLIVGGGPSGLMLANEFGARNTPTLLVDAKPSTAFNPQANATQARTMEYYRRHGFANEIRQSGLPPDHPTDIAYFTRYSTYELARLSLPTSAQASLNVRKMGGSWSAAELPHRISQKYVEPILRKHAEKWSTNDIRFAWKMTRYERHPNHVDAWIQPVDESSPETHVRCQYLVGADGPRSGVRQSLGISYSGDTGVKRGYMGGLMFAVYFRSPDLFTKIPHSRSWMYVTVNNERRSLLMSVNGVDEFAFHASLHDDETASDWDHKNAYQVISESLGCDLEVDILSYLTWTAGHALYTEKMSDGPIFLMGDAAHLFTPTGGLGYNTAVEDAVNLGWKLASVIHGHSPKQLLDTYTLERSPIAKRNTTYARGFADSVGLFKVSHDFELDTPKGIADRELASQHFNDHARKEFNIPGITFGTRYSNSPIIASEAIPEPLDQANVYEPCAKPGGRPPHLWINDDLSLFDTFGMNWTLLCLGEQASEHDAFIQAAIQYGIDLQVLHHPHPDLHSLYQAKLVLIRPDQIVAWRGDHDDQALEVLKRALGWNLQ